MEPCGVAVYGLRHPKPPWCESEAHHMVSIVILVNMKLRATFSAYRCLIRVVVISSGPDIDGYLLSARSGSFCVMTRDRIQLDMYAAIE